MTEQRSITTEAVASSKLPQDVTLVEVELLSKHADLKHANKELQGRRAWLLEMLAGKELKQSAVQETLNCTSNTQAAECTLVAVAKFEDRQVALEVYNTIAKVPALQYLRAVDVRYCLYSNCSRVKACIG
eukprot:TRINITY_DN6625_c0_g1_i2.p1 TRINITY_DN6625_c0_g1~~TRINITY_DN6625_c0_g1_i2.p1  ORF type:complete len:130 (+),score=28.92 TRINITY_DN6625_c0_g1_i2:61-450(+)